MRPRTEISLIMQKNRRALIKGGLAVPLVFTVRTASAQVASSAWACAARDARLATEVQPQNVLVGTNDEWVRVKRELWEIRRLTSGGSVVARNSESAGFFLSEDNMAFFELIKDAVDGTYRIDKHLLGSLQPKYTTANYGTYGASIGQANFLAYQENGEIVASALDDSIQGDPITGSCWCSLPGLAV